MTTAKRGLGKGLDALLKDISAPDTLTGKSQDRIPDRTLVLVPISRIRASRVQPRRRFDPHAMAELVASVRQRGILTPLFLRRDGTDYQLIAGERRLRAATEAGLTEVPAILWEASDDEALLTALVENIQRENLNLLEEAEAYQTLATRFGLTQEQIAHQVGKARPSIANALRLLDLPERIRALIAEGSISPGHAKALLAVDGAEQQWILAQRIVQEDLSVRQVERLARKLRSSPTRKRVIRHSDIPEDHLRFLCERLQQHVGTAVRILPCRTLPNGRKVRGTLEMDFYSSEDLDRLLQILGIEL